MDLLFARGQMAISLAFHIIFACIGIAMPFLMAVSHWKWLHTKDENYLELTRAWSRGVAIFFATGAVSGTVLSFELGLLWPEFMKHAGPIIGMPFSWEGSAFFLEAIALGLFLHGWDRMRPWVHWATGLAVGICGALSGIFIVCASGWMNSPAGFRFENGMYLDIDPVAAMFNQASHGMGLHMTLAAFQATGFAVAGLHAFLLLKGYRRDLHSKAVVIALLFGGVAGILQPLSGHLLAQDVAQRQPEKLAATESLFETQAPAPLIIGGIPSIEEKKVRLGIEIPAMLSFLAHGDFKSAVTGLDSFPQNEWPPVLITHLAFQIMVGAGFLMALVGLTAVIFLFRKQLPRLLSPRFLKAVAIVTPLGFISVEAGWFVTELGRQPWIIYRVMRTADAVTPMPGLIVPFSLFTLVYLFLAFMVVWLMTRQIKALG